VGGVYEANAPVDVFASYSICAIGVGDGRGEAEFVSEGGNECM